LWWFSIFTAAFCLQNRIRVLQLLKVITRYNRSTQENNCVWLMQFKPTDLSVLIPTVNEEAIDILTVSFYQFEFSFIRGLHFLFIIVYEFCFRYFTNLIEVLQSLLSWDPVKWPAAAESLRHPFFQVY
jgi:hypothetical protein